MGNTTSQYKYPKHSSSVTTCSKSITLVEGSQVVDDLVKVFSNSNSLIKPKVRSTLKKLNRGKFLHICHYCDISRHIRSFALD